MEDQEISVARTNPFPLTSIRIKRNLKTFIIMYILSLISFILEIFAK